MEEARRLMNEAMDAEFDEKDFSKAAEKYEEAAKVYEEAGMKDSAKSCRDMVAIVKEKMK